MKLILVMAALVTWLAGNTDLPMPAQPPSVEAVAPERAWHIVMGDRPFPADPDDGRVLGAYVDGTIWLSTDLDLDTPFGRSVLLHELVHFYQDEAGLVFPCLDRQEEHAYRIQQRWLADQGVDIWDHLDGLYTMLVWRAGCDSAGTPEGAR